MLRDVAAIVAATEELGAALAAAEARAQAAEQRVKDAVKVLEPFVAMIVRSDEMDTAWLAENAPGMDIEAYTPSTDKIVSSGEMRNPVFVTRGQFRAAAAFIKEAGE